MTMGKRSAGYNSVPWHPTNNLFNLAVKAKDGIGSASSPKHTPAAFMTNTISQDESAQGPEMEQTALIEKADLGRPLRYIAVLPALWSEHHEGPQGSARPGVPDLVNPN